MEPVLPPLEAVFSVVEATLDSPPLDGTPLASGSGIESRAREWIAAASGPWQYLLVFALAATPLLEILVVIPNGVALSLDPVAVGAVAFAGNVLPIYGIVLGHDRLSAWLERRRGEGDEEPKRRARAKRIWNTYGLPGLAVLAPVATGVHLAAVIALGLGARGRATAAWMTASIAVWTVLITATSVLGLSALAWLR